MGGQHTERRRKETKRLVEGEKSNLQGSLGGPVHLTSFEIVFHKSRKVSSLRFQMNCSDSSVSVYGIYLGFVPQGCLHIKQHVGTCKEGIASARKNTFLLITFQRFL